MDTLPYVVGEETSREAAEGVGRSGKNRADARLIWDYFVSCGDQGATADEVIVHLAGRVSHSTVTARIRGLKDSQVLVRHPSGVTRQTRSGRRASVWVVAPQAEFSHYKEGIRWPSLEAQTMGLVKALVMACKVGNAHDKERALSDLLRLHGYQGWTSTVAECSVCHGRVFTQLTPTRYKCVGCSTHKVSDAP